MKSYAQASQDVWAARHTGTRGYFVDVGAHDGIVHSNTYALEQLGWQGICIEPNLTAFEQLRANRKCLLSRYAISDQDGLISFNGVQVGPVDEFEGRLVECRTLTTLLDIVKAPPTIDYLSIDVEGHELAVLAGMDWDRYMVRLLTVEHNLYLRGPDHKNVIAAFLEDRGFKRDVEDVVAPGYGAYEDWWRGIMTP